MVGSGSQEVGATAAPDPLLALTGIHVHYGGVQALRGAHLSIYPGEVHALLGENGAGKSTLVKVIAGAVAPILGEIEWGGTLRGPTDIGEAMALGIRVIYQKLNTVPDLTVAQNVVLGSEPRRLGLLRPRQERKIAAAALSSLGFALDLGRLGATLSIAERQLLEIAGALHGRVRLLVMDEPTASLGEHEVERLFEVIRGLRDQGVAVVFISHKLQEVMEIADRITVLRDGGTIGTVPVEETSPERLVQMMVGRDLDEGLRLKRSVPSDEVVLEAREISTDTGLRSVSLYLRRGEVLGVYGLVGSGRTELLRALYGADPLTAGGIVVGGQTFAPGNPRDGKRAGFGFVAEDRQQSTFDELSVRENISSASGELISRVGVVRRSREHGLVRPMFEALRIRAQSMEAPIRSLSGGNQQKAVLGRWLARKAPVLLLDDPTTGIDVGAKVEIYRLIDEQTAVGSSVVLTSSELPELIDIANRVLVLREGRAVGTLEGERISQDRILVAALRGVIND